jgi:hypothetical protein
MSRREDNVGCINVAIMDRFAHSALPSPYSKIFPAFWASAAVTHVDLSASITNRSDFKGNPAQRTACTVTLAPGQPDSSMLSAPSRIFFRDLLHRLNGKIQRTVAARDPFEERPEIESRQKPSLTLEHFRRQLVAVIEHCVDLARQAAKPGGVFVLHPQAQDPDSRSVTGHPYSIPKGDPITPWQTSRNAGHAVRAVLRTLLLLACFKARSIGLALPFTLCVHPAGVAACSNHREPS